MLKCIVLGVYEKKDANGEDSRIIRRSDVDPARRITLSERDVRMMQSFKKEFERIGTYGWSFYVTSLNIGFVILSSLGILGENVLVLSLYVE